MRDVSRVRGRAGLAVFAALAIGLTMWPARATVHYVWQGSPSPVSPYTNWTTAAHDIQSAVDASVDADTVLVTNGVYATGGRIAPGFPPTNRVVMTNNVSLESVNGPAVTAIQGRYDPGTGGDGSNAVRCACLTGGGRIVGFTLTNGAVATSPYDIHAITGGGLYLEAGEASNLVIRNCHSDYGGGGVLLGQSAFLQYCSIFDNTSGFGGGVMYNGGATMRNCRVVRNSGSPGGGVFVGLGGTIEACTIAGNQAVGDAGGLYASFATGLSVIDTIIFGNSASSSNNEYHVFTNSFSYSCTQPLPPGPGNIAADPQFRDNVNFNIRSSSPCLNAGTNLDWMTGGADIDDETRVRDGVVDIGADEAWNYAAISLVQTGNLSTIRWDTKTDGTFQLMATTNLPAQIWGNVGSTSTSSAAWLTTVATNPVLPFRAFRLQRMGP